MNKGRRGVLNFMSGLPRRLPYAFSGRWQKPGLFLALIFR